MKDYGFVSVSIEIFSIFKDNPLPSFIRSSAAEMCEDERSPDACDFFCLKFETCCSLRGSSPAPVAPTTPPMLIEMEETTFLGPTVASRHSSLMSCLVLFHVGWNGASHFVFPCHLTVGVNPAGIRYTTRQRL